MLVWCLQYVISNLLKTLYLFVKTLHEIVLKTTT